MTKQQFTSKETSISTVNKIYTNIDFKGGYNILDYGGGKYDNNIEYMAKKGNKVVVYDPYNRSNEYNKQTIAFVNTQQIHFIVCSNVLNVIQEDSVLEEVLVNIRRIKNSHPECQRVYISVYEGDKSGRARETTKGWQRNLKTKEYYKWICKYFSIVATKNGILVCE